MEDEQIVELYLNRDESAVYHTAEKYGRRLRALALGVVGDAQTAELEQCVPASDDVERRLDAMALRRAESWRETRRPRRNTRI